MTEITRRQTTLLTTEDFLNKDSLIDKLVEISLKYARGLVRQEYVKIRNPSKEEMKRGIWREDDYIFLEQDVEEECLRLCTELADKLKESAHQAIRDHLSEDAEDA